jgi:hypothetical protein
MAYKEPSALNVVSMPIYICIILSIYCGWKYLPTWWQQQEYQDMMGAVISNANRVGEDALQATIITRMGQDFDVKNINPQDVVVIKSKGWVDATYYFDVTIDHYVWKHTFTLKATSRKRIIDM